MWAGTHTDAVIMDGKHGRNIDQSADQRRCYGRRRQCPRHRAFGNSALPTDAIQSVMIGTTQFTNAIVERRQLAETGVFRLCLPAGRGLPPMVDWPDDIANAVGRHSVSATWRVSL